MQGIDNSGSTGPLLDDVQDAVRTGKVGDATTATRPNTQPVSALADAATFTESVDVPADKVVKSEKQPALDNQKREATLAEAGLESAHGTVAPKDLSIKADPRTAAALEHVLGGPDTAVAPPKAPPITVTPAHVDGAMAFAANIDTAMKSAMTNPDGTPRSFDQMASDVLLSAFMKLQILNPMDSTQTQQDLAEVMSNLRQQGISEAKQAIKNQVERQKEAEKDKMFMQIIQVLIIVVAIVLIVVLVILTPFTGGLSLALVAGVLAIVAVLMAAMAASMEVQEKASDDEQEIEDSKASMESDQIRLDAMENPNDVLRRILERRAQEEIEKQRLETMQGPDGQPIKGVPGMLKNALKGAMNQIMQIAQEQGSAAALQQAPALIKAAMIPELKAQGYEPAERIADAIAKEAVEQMSSEMHIELAKDAGALMSLEGTDEAAAHLQAAGFPTEAALAILNAAQQDPAKKVPIIAGSLAGISKGMSPEDAARFVQALLGGGNPAEVLNQLLGQIGQLPAATSPVALAMLTKSMGHGLGLGDAAKSGSLSDAGSLQLSELLDQLLRVPQDTEALQQWATDAQDSHTVQLQEQRGSIGV